MRFTTILLMALFTAQSALASDTVKVDLNSKKPVVNKTILNVDSDRVMVLKGPVENANMNALVKQLKELAENPKKPAYLDIDSPGGSVLAGLNFIEAMQDLKKSKGLKVTCVVRRAAYSMAAAIAMYCHETYMMPFSDLMFHGASYGVSGPADIIFKRVMHITLWLRELESELARQLGLPLATFLHIRQPELWLLPKRASELGFVNGIIRSFYHEAEPPKVPQRFFIFGEAGEDAPYEDKSDVQYIYTGESDETKRCN